MLSDILNSWVKRQACMPFDVVSVTVSVGSAVAISVFTWSDGCCVSVREKCGLLVDRCCAKF